MRAKTPKTSDEVGHQISADFRNPPKEVRKFCRDKHRAAAPFSFVHFFWATQKKWTNGFKRCEAPFAYRMRPCENWLKGVKHPLISLHDPCEKGLQRRQPLTTSPVAGQTGFKGCETPFKYYCMIHAKKDYKGEALCCTPTLGYLDVFRACPA